MSSRRDIQRRTLRVLGAAQAFGSIGFYMGVTLALLARDVSGAQVGPEVGS